MSDITTLMMAASGGVAGAYEIERSLRFNSADSAYLSRTPASAGNRKTWTWSGWYKRTKITQNGSPGLDELFVSGASDGFVIRFNTNDTIRIYNFDGGLNLNLITSAVYRDASSWYHVVVAIDTTQATDTNRAKLYVNGTQVTAFGTSVYPTQNTDLLVNQAIQHSIGSNLPWGSSYADCYLTEINFIDGQALTPSSFGEVNADTGVWSPIRYAGSYGTTGFYLNFSDNSGVTATTLGKDSSGNGNDWTPNNFSVTAGAGNDSLVDTPTQYGTGNSGGDVRGNFCTLNPLTKGTYLTLSNGNLQTAGNSATDSTDARSTFAFSTGKWYWEFTPTTINSIYPFNGIIQSKNATSPNTGTTNQVGVATDSCAYLASGSKRISNSTTSYGDSYTANDVIGVAVDADNGAIYFSKNGTYQNSGVPTSGASKTGAAFTWTGGSLEFVAAVSEYNTSASSINFGARAFSSTAPSGFKALVTTNLPDPTVVQGDDHFNTVLYTGTGSSLGVTGVGFQPDFTWIKERSGAADHGLYDAVRGVTKQLESNTTTDETTEATGLTAFGADGFTVGALAQLNTSADTYVAWNWKANGAGASNTAGSITSTVSANTTAGISIVTYTGNGSAGATVGHGLGSAPKMIIVKGRSTSYDWRVYHASVGNGYIGFINTTAAFSTNTTWNNTTPSSTVFTLGSELGANQNSATHVAYCFAAIPGFSAFGSYTGNGSADGPFVYTGFRPAFVLIKRYDGGSYDWWMFDAKRGPRNFIKARLYANDSSAEHDLYEYIDFTSNGFKLRAGEIGINGNGNSYIYAAFAENPFKFSLAR